MNGPEHYRQAELLLMSCQSAPPDEDGEAYPAAAFDGVDNERNALMAAQVHATLALAAATMDAPMYARAADVGVPPQVLPDKYGRAWDEATS